MSLKDIIGQDRAIETLCGIMLRQKIATSYLFCGESGIGKRTTAIEFAKALNCLKTGKPDTGTQDPVDACDECASCLKIAAGAHPDFLLVFPEERLIRIEEIRLIDEALSFRPFEGRRKIVVVDDADAMNTPAANAFLKTLEEPPEDSVIILISSKPDLLPDTIRSRCSRINYFPLSSGDCRKVLGEKIPEADIDLVVRLSMGRPGGALANDLKEERTWFINLFNDMLRAEKDGWASREEMERWFEMAMILLRDIALLKIKGNALGLVNMDLDSYLNNISKFTDLKGILYIYNLFSELKNLLGFNLNKSITWNVASALLRKELAV